MAGAARGRRTAILSKVYTWFANWCAGGRKSLLKVYLSVCKRWKTVYIVAKKVYIRGYETAEKVYIVAKKVYMVTKKVYVVAEKVYMIYRKKA